MSEQVAKKIVLTGGPSSGKTTVGMAIVKEFPLDVALVPESASILYMGGFPRKVSRHAKIYQQTAIYHVQKSLESIIEDANPGKILICDRGSLDGLAYWGHSEKSFFKAIGSSMKAELERYDAVLKLKLPEKAQYNGNCSEIRIESYIQAQRIDRSISEVWSGHKNIIEIPNQNTFAEKIEYVIDYVSTLIER